MPTPFFQRSPLYVPGSEEYAAACPATGCILPPDHPEWRLQEASESDVDQLFGEAKKGKKTKAPPSLDQLLSTAKCGPASWTEEGNGEK